jgi:hypothetical protein
MHGDMPYSYRSSLRDVATRRVLSRFRQREPAANPHSSENIAPRRVGPGLRTIELDNYDGSKKGGSLLIASQISLTWPL